MATRKPEKASTGPRPGLPALLIATGLALGAGAGAGDGTGADAPANTRSASAALTLESVLAGIGGKPRLEARYTETHHLAVLDAPLESSGVVRYQAPDRLEKTTETPRRETLSIDGDSLVLERDGRRRSLPAAQLPGVAALVGAMRDTLAGNALALRRMFRVTVQGSPEQWQIDLLPNDAASAELVVRITLRGSGAQLSEIELLRADGDRSVMRLSESSAR